MGGKGVEGVRVHSARTAFHLTIKSLGSCPPSSPHLALDHPESRVLERRHAGGLAHALRSDTAESWAALCGLCLLL